LERRPGKHPDKTAKISGESDIEVGAPAKQKYIMSVKIKDFKFFDVFQVSSQLKLIGSIITQEPISDETKEQISKLESPNLQKIHADLSDITDLVCRIGGDRITTIGQFCKDWSLTALLNFPVVAKLTLGNIQSLANEIEDRLLDDLVEKCDPKFKMPLTEVHKEYLSQNISQNKQKYKETNKALKRFIVSELRTGSSLTPKNRLVEHINMNQFWDTTCLEQEELQVLLGPGFVLENAHATHKHIKQVLSQSNVVQPQNPKTQTYAKKTGTVKLREEKY